MIDISNSGYKSSQTSYKRRIVTDKECEIDLKDYINHIFNAVKLGVDRYNTIRGLFSNRSAIRGNDASNLNRSIVESIQNYFADNWYFGKYKRFILRLKGYIFLVKKLDKSGYPMYNKTKNSILIDSQHYSDIFGCENGDTTFDPIVYIGYQVNKIGEVVNLQLVYIDEGYIKWIITGSDAAAEVSFTPKNPFPIPPVLSSGVNVALKDKGTSTKKIN